MKKIVAMSICMLIGLISMSFGQRRVAFKSNLGDYMKPANNGVLVFASPSVGTSETFELISRGGNQYALKASNGYYVCATNGGGTVLEANRNQIGAWETFTLINVGGNQYALKASNGQFVCAEEGGGRGRNKTLAGKIRANRNGIGAWETFTLIDVNW